jgi:hypothetical protein
VDAKYWIAEVAEKSRKLLTGRRRIYPAPRLRVPGSRWRTERFLPWLRESEEISVVRQVPQAPVSPPDARCMGKEFPNESAGAGPAVRGSVPGKWTAPYHPQTFRRLATGYRPRDIGLPPEGRERRHNGPCRTVSSPVDISSMVRKSQLLASWLYFDSKGKNLPMN